MVFFKRGWTKAFLNDDEKIPSEREIDKICDNCIVDRS